MNPPSSPNEPLPASLPPWLAVQGKDIRLSVKLQPRASANEIGQPLGGELKIKVTAPPVDSAANEALLEFLAETLDCGRQKIELIRGKTSRHKVILLHDLRPGVVHARLVGR